MSDRPLPSTHSPLPLQTIVAVPLAIVLVATGLKNALLVIALSATLLLNPWVRTLLELPTSGPGQKSTSSLSRFDPTRYISSLQSDAEEDKDQVVEEELDEGGQEVSPDGYRPDDRRLGLDVLPSPVRRPLGIMAPLVVRDFVKYWYDPIAFKHPAFPRQAGLCFEHMAASIYLAFEPQSNVEVASNLLLTTCSVLLAAMRTRRTQAGPDGPPPNPYSWPDTAARLSTLRTAVRRLLATHLPHPERTSLLILSLMTEVLTKQLWEVIKKIGDPDFINCKIVEAAEVQSSSSPRAAAGNLPTPTTLASPSPVTSVEVDSPAALSRGPPAAHKAQPPVQSELRGRGSTPSIDSRPPHLPARPPRSQTSTPIDPLASIGSFASSAFGSVGRAANRTANALGEALDEVGNSLIVSTTTPPPTNGQRQVSPSPNPARRKPIPPMTSDAYRESSPHIALPQKEARRLEMQKDQERDLIDMDTVMHMDIPASDSERRNVELPQSLRRGLREGSDGQDGYVIRDDVISQTATHNKPPLPARPQSASFAPSSPKRMFPSLSDVLSRQSPDIYDAFESWLESHPAVPGARDGETLLRLHTQLHTLQTIVRLAAPDPDTFREDASSILRKTAEGLEGVGPVAAAVRNALEDLRRTPELSTLLPLDAVLDDSLGQLYKAFCSSNGGTRSTRASPRAPPLPLSGSSRPATPTRTPASTADSTQSPHRPRSTTAGDVPLSSQAPSGATAAFAYEPRKRAGTSTPPPNTHSPARMSRQQSEVDLQRRTASSSQESPPPSPYLYGGGLPAPSSLAASPAAPVEISVGVTDVSPIPASAAAASDATRTVDLRTLELMIAVEGFGQEGGGFVLMRRWKEVEALDLELRRLTARQPRKSVLDAAVAGTEAEDYLPTPPPLPALRNKTSYATCRELEAYFIALLSSAPLCNTDVARRFFDKTLAGASSAPPAATAAAAAEALRSARGGTKALFSGFSGIGKSVTSGISGKGRATPEARSGVMTVDTDQGGKGSIEASAPSRNQSSDSAASFLDTAASGPNPAGSHSRYFSGTNGNASSSATPPSASLSPAALDTLLAAFFAVADEAFDLSGGWTLRRGMLRVLEQIVRASYGASIISGFDHTASALSAKGLGEWGMATVDDFWPPPSRTWSEEKSPVRDEQTKRLTAERAREVLVSYAPPQAGYMLGPGGKQSCVNALRTLHETIEDERTALDLALTIVLRVLDMACPPVAA